MRRGPSPHLDPGQSPPARRTSSPLSGSFPTASGAGAGFSKTKPVARITRAGCYSQPPLSARSPTQRPSELRGGHMGSPALADLVPAPGWAKVHSSARVGCSVAQMRHTPRCSWTKPHLGSLTCSMASSTALSPRAELPAPPSAEPQHPASPPASPCSGPVAPPVVPALRRGISLMEA